LRERRRRNCGGVAEARCRGWEFLLAMVRNAEKMVFMEVLWRGADSGEDRCVGDGG